MRVNTRYIKSSRGISSNYKSKSWNVVLDRTVNGKRKTSQEQSIFFLFFLNASQYLHFICNYNRQQYTYHTLQEQRRSPNNNHVLGGFNGDEREKITNVLKITNSCLIYRHNTPYHMFWILIIFQEHKTPDRKGFQSDACVHTTVIS